MLQMTLMFAIHAYLGEGQTTNRPILGIGPFHLQVTTIRLCILLFRRQSFTLII
jgi:hypothetical protein